MKIITAMVLSIQLLFVATLFGETKQGNCTLKQGDTFDKNVFIVQIGNKIKGTSKFYIQDFFGKKVISANIQIMNTSNKPMHCQYYVAFFDKAGTLIGCAGQSTFSNKGLAAGESTQLGSCFIPLPSGLHEKVAKYQIVFYESNTEIGKKKNRKADSNNFPRTLNTPERKKGTKKGTVNAKDSSLKTPR